MQVDTKTGKGYIKNNELMALVCSEQKFSSLLVSKSHTAIIPEQDPVAINERSLLTYMQQMSSLTWPPTECLSGWSSSEISSS